MKISSLAVNSAKAEAGAWVKNIPSLPGIELRVRGRGNADARELRAKLYAEIPRADRLVGVSPKTEETIETEVMVETILTDWRGFTDDAKAPLVFSKDVARSYLANPDYGILRGAVIWAADAVAEIGVDDAEADKGN